MRPWRRRHLVAIGPSRQAHVIGLRPAFFSDLYYVLLNRSWRYLLVLVSVAYFGANALFALGYVASGDCLVNARPGSFEDAFFFSVQTMSTIGYGYIYPNCLAANILVTLESFLGLMAFAVVTGIAFNKFARPRARVMFTEVATVALHDGVPTLMFRMANERSNYIADATVHVVLVKPSLTAEGRQFTRMYDLKMVRHRSSMFTLTWTALHHLDAHSPLAGETAASLISVGAFIVCTLTGFDATIGQTIHARHVYTAESIRWGVRFADVLTRAEGSKDSLIDYRRFHTVEAEPGAGGG